MVPGLVVVQLPRVGRDYPVRRIGVSGLSVLFGAIPIRSRRWRASGLARLAPNSAAAGQCHHPAHSAGKAASDPDLHSIEARSAQPSPYHLHRPDAGARTLGESQVGATAEAPRGVPLLLSAISIATLAAVSAGRMRFRQGRLGLNRLPGLAGWERGPAGGARRPWL